MTPVRLLMSSSLTVGIGAVWWFRGWAQPRPRLQRVLRHLDEDPSSSVVRRTVHPRDLLTPMALGQRLADPLLERHASKVPLRVDDTDLHLLHRSREQHLLRLLLAAVVGAFGPVVLITISQIQGVLELSIVWPVGLSLLGLVVGPLLMHRRDLDHAARLRVDLRFQLSAYLDVVTMLLAANTGHEGALLRAAQAGDGRLFGELLSRMRDATVAGRSLVSSLEQTGVDLGLVELRQVASSVALSAAEGSPVARSLAAKCATIRSTLASEQETEARLRTSRLTAPLVGMALIFMALVVYPALQM